MAPWFKTRKNLSCETDIPIKHLNNTTANELLNFYLRLETLDMFTFEPKVCPKPCTTMNILIKTRNAGYGMASGSVMVIWKSDQVYFSCLL